MTTYTIDDAKHLIIEATLRGGTEPMVFTHESWFAFCAERQIDPCDPKFMDKGTAEHLSAWAEAHRSPPASP